MDEPLPLRAHKVCFFSQRFITLLMTSIGVMLNMVFRLMISTVIHQFSVHKTYFSMSNISICNRTINTTSDHLVSSNLYNWDSTSYNFIRSSYWIGYALTLVPGGVLSDKFGGKSVITGSTITSCFLILVLPKIIKASGGNYIVLGSGQILLGIFVGPVLPAANTMISFWAPLTDRGKLCALVYCASQMSIVLNNALTKAIIVHWMSWESVFYFYAILGLIWVFLWHCFCFYNPWDNPYMDEEEFNFLDQNLAQHVTPGNKPIPWSSLFTCIHFYVFVLAHCSHRALWHTFLHDIPIFIESVLKFSFDEFPAMKIVPYILMVILLNCFGHFVDYLVTYDFVSLSNIRKMFAIFGLMGPPIFAVFALYSGCSKYLLIMHFTTAVTLMSCYFIGAKANSLDLAPNFSGVILGVAQATSVLWNIVLPYLVENFILIKGVITEWKILFWTHMLLTSVITLLYIIFGSAEEQDWNNEDEEERDSE